MATQNLLQRLDVAADTTGSSVDASNRRIEEVFIASEAITAGDFVTLDLAQSDDSDKLLKVAQLDNAAFSSNHCVGVAIENAAIGDNVRVCLRGIIEANVATGSTEGKYLMSSSTGGRAAIATQFLTDAAGGGADTLVDVPQMFAYALEDAASNSAKVFVIPQF
jgi:hypothetical protein